MDRLFFCQLAKYIMTRGTRLLAIAATVVFPIWSAAAGDCALSRITEMPMTPDADGSPLVTILMDGQPRKVLLDTGGFWSLIDPTVAQSYKVGASDIYGQLGLNGIPLTKMAHVPSVQLGIMKFSRADFFVAPSGYLGMDATLGANWLMAFDVEIDPVKSTVSLLSPKHCPGQVIYWPHQDLAEIPIEINKREKRITIPLILNGHEIRALIDTGSSDTVLNAETAERLFGLTGQSPGMELLSSQFNEYGTKREMFRYQFQSVTMGDVTFNHPWLHVAPMSEHGIDIILGMHQLRGLHLYFAYDEEKLYVTSARGDLAALKASGAIDADSHSPDPQDRINAKDHMQEASLALKKGDKAGAAIAVDLALRRDPTFAFAYLTRADVELAQGDRNRAFEDLQEAVRRDPTNPDIYEERERIYAEAGVYDLAFKDADKLVQGEPRNPRRLNSRCWFGAILGKYEDATADCNAALALDPNDAPAFDSRAFIYFKTARLDLALADYSAALKHNQHASSSLYGRGLVKRQTGDKSGGDDDIAAALKIDPDIEKHFGK